MTALARKQSDLFSGVVRRHSSVVVAIVDVENVGHIYKVFERKTAVD